MAGLPTFVDIDGTLTDLPTKMWGQVDRQRLQYLRDLIRDGREIVLWTGGGTEYAKAFAERYDFAPAFCIGKPSLVVDDNPTIRPAGRMRIISPAEFFGS